METGSSKEVVVATWEFGAACVDAAVHTLKQGGTALDAVESGAAVAEADPANRSVGFGGTPNRDGVVQVDAAIMWGPGRQAGSVAALEGILHPISVARRVMEVSPHVMLAGEGAARFALEQGFEEVDLLTEETRKQWEVWRETRAGEGENHDTIGVVALDSAGNLAASCSTSGAGYKFPGRVGDSPIIGSGLYVDNDVGAAAATGLGEDIMRYCACYEVVAQMARGHSPDEACSSLLRSVLEKDPKGADASISLVALNKEGAYGGSGMQKGFPYAVAAGAETRVLRGAGVV
ncbi:MAG: glycosylasparaginase [Gemmatimonadetes bacterium]|nr:glycosylasparaginase [Gemmatimonadota bacterium]